MNWKKMNSNKEIKTMKEKAPRNRTLFLNEEDKARYSKRLVTFTENAKLEDVVGKTINQDLLEVASFLPESFVDLLIVDPPYNLNKNFNGKVFKKSSFDEYENYTRNWLEKIIHTLKSQASVYVCSDWETSLVVYNE